MLRASTALILSLSSLPALAEVPSVMVDTMPLHSLVAQVMAGVGEPALLLPPGASPHDFQLRPSDAAALAGADVVIWTGESLAPWLLDPLATLAPEALTLEVLDTAGWTALPLRDDAAFDDGHDHAAEKDNDHAAEAEAGHEDHDHTAGAGHDDHDHSHDGSDPHAWLSPDVAAVWMGHIAETLALADPDNAQTYRANATDGAARLAALKSEIAGLLAPVQGRAFVVPHDAYQYFETSFGMPAAGAIALSDAAAPGPARIAALRDRVMAEGIACILTDPQTSADWSAVLQDNTTAGTAMADPDGTLLTPGPALYDDLMRGIAAALVDCLS